MRKIWKRVTAAALSLTFVLSLSACGGGGLSADDATTYVQGILDENYKGVYDPDFLELIDITENEAEETYLSSLETEADFFASAFLIDDLTDELKAEVVDMYMPKRLLEEPVVNGPSTGMTSKLPLTLPEYYEARGWVNAFPTDETLKKLGLDECVGK